MLCATINDYIDNTQESFKNKVYVRVYLKKCVDYYLLLYQEYFVWIAKNAFHQDKFLVDHRPGSIDPTLEKETKRKDIKNFLKKEDVVRNLMKRDAVVLEEFVQRKADFFAESYLETFKGSNELLMRKLFGGEHAERQQKSAIKFLDEAVKKVKENFKK